jgi:hypothetical protein
MDDQIRELIWLLPKREGANFIIIHLQNIKIPLQESAQEGFRSSAE